jgi:nucleoid-associated protein YgaU
MRLLGKLVAAGAAVLALTGASFLASPRTGAIGSYHPCPSSVGGDRCVTVQRGDWLWAIAREALKCGTGRQGAVVTNAQVGAEARDIYRANRARIGRNPNRIRPGTELVIPGGCI